VTGKRCRTWLSLTGMLAGNAVGSRDSRHRPLSTAGPGAPGVGRPIAAGTPALRFSLLTIASAQPMIQPDGLTKRLARKRLSMARTQKPANEPRRRILDVAAEAFAASGFEGARVDQIAERAAVNKAMLYYHVGDKDVLYATVMLETIDDALGRLDRAVATSRSAEERLRSVISTIADAARRHPHFPSLMLREIASGGATLPDRVVERMRLVFQAVSEALEAGAKSGEFRAVDPLSTHMFIAGSLLVLLAGGPIRRRLRQISKIRKAPVSDRSTADIASFVADSVLDGLRAPAPAPARRRRRAAAAKKK
jgi:TetR/AcrR family transcriptional regulator